MPGPVSRLLRADAPPADAVPDGELLRRFHADRDQAAFELLVRRYAPLVRRVCRGVLADSHAAEDAAQATFLILARKAGSLSGSRPAAGWLCRVAHRAATRLRSKRRPPPVTEPPPTPDPADAAAAKEAARAVQDEVARLPARYHAPVVLCYFDGLTHAEAAARLGWPVGTVAGRLARGRAVLRDRLARRGIAPAAALAVAHETVSATGPSPAAVALSREVLRAMTMTRFAFAALLVGLAVIAAVEAGAGDDRPKPAPVRADPPVKDEQLAKEKKFVVVGKVVGDDGKTPIEGVVVSASAGMGSLRRTGETKTDADGKFRLVFTQGILLAGGRAGGVAVVFARKPGWYGFAHGWPAQYVLTDGPLPPDQMAEVPKGFDMLQPGVPSPLEFRMRPAASLRARLTDAAGKPMAGARVYLTGKDLYPASSVLASGKTDADGVFTATEVPRSRYRLVLEGPERAELELGSIQFIDAVEYRVDVQVREWTPAVTSFTTTITAGGPK